MPIPKKDDKALKMLKRMLAKPRTIPELMEATGQAERTVYRWFRYLEEEGVTVASRKGLDYKIRFWSP